jgi:hypothetical protein
MGKLKLTTKFLTHSVARLKVRYPCFIAPIFHNRWNSWVPVSYRAISFPHTRDFITEAAKWCE